MSASSRNQQSRVNEKFKANLKFKGVVLTESGQPPFGTEIFMAWMHILECCDGSYYVGSTKNLELRFLQHESGKGSRYTSGRLPVKLVCCEEYDRVSEAFYREKQVQGWTRRKREALINGNPELLPALAKKAVGKNKIKDNSLVE